MHLLALLCELMSWSTHEKRREKGREKQCHYPTSPVQLGSTPSSHQINSKPSPAVGSSGANFIFPAG